MSPIQIVNIILGLTMVGFAAVQYNDPDMPQWVLLYAIPALWMYAVTFRLQSIARSKDLTVLLGASVVFYIVTVVYYWPTMPNFWLKEVWIVEETAREGMGLMIALGVVVVAVVNLKLPSTERRARDRDAAPQVRST